MFENSQINTLAIEDGSISVGGTIGWIDDCFIYDCYVVDTDIYVSSPFSMVGGIGGYCYDNAIASYLSFEKSSITLQEDVDPSCQVALVLYGSGEFQRSIEDVYLRVNNAGNISITVAPNTLTFDRVVIESDTSIAIEQKQFYCSDCLVDWENWAIVNGRPLLKQFFWIAQASTEKVSYDTLITLGYNQLTA